MKTLFYGVCGAAFLVSGCAASGAYSSQASVTEQAERENLPMVGGDVEAISFLGQPLYRNSTAPQLDAQAKIDALLASGAATEDAFLELGAELAGAGLYQDAIAAYTAGLRLHSDSFKLRRHRAHRYLTVREVEKAHADLDEALELVNLEETPSIEMKGGEPHGSYEHWIWYHLGIYYYLTQDYDNAAMAYEHCLETASSNDMLIGVVDWLYNIYRKNGEDAKAEAVLTRIPADIEADTTYPYYKRVMFYKGLMSADEILDPAKPLEEWNARDATIAYALSNWAGFNGDVTTANELRAQVLATNVWNIWAYICAEKEEAVYRAEN
ncbi:MAG: hypothetical protein GYB49_01955 [Alphaproteobacteria bacterium]|nr:hypothetical protein [Alphaproteobacteria bacterium]|tara:strand:+ start:7702 stop:8676 length:975 start_codon:yes stop_codon:yes gene_type:complete